MFTIYQLPLYLCILLIQLWFIILIYLVKPKIRKNCPSYHCSWIWSIFSFQYQYISIILMSLYDRVSL